MYCFLPIENTPFPRNFKGKNPNIPDGSGNGEDVKTLDEFDFGRQPSINELLVRELAEGQCIDNRENVLLIGSSCVGKTHLFIALGLAACGQGRKVRFFRMTELVTLLKKAKRGEATPPVP